MPIMYAFVARGQDVLCEHAAFQGNFAKVAAECLAKCPTNNAKFTFNADKHTFNFIVHNGFSACPRAASECSILRRGTSHAALTPPRPPQLSWPWPTRSMGARFRSATWRR